MVLIHNRTAIIDFLVEAMSRSLGLPTERVRIVSLLIGSLIAVIEIQRNMSQVLPEAFISDVIANLTDFQNITDLYRDVSGDLIGGVFGRAAVSIDINGIDIASICDADCFMGIGLAVGICSCFVGLLAMMLYVTGHCGDHDDDHAVHPKDIKDNPSHHPFGEDEVTFEDVFTDSYYSDGDEVATHTTSSGLSSYDHWREVEDDYRHRPPLRHRQQFLPFDAESFEHDTTASSSFVNVHKHHSPGNVDELTVSAPYSPGGQSSWYSTSPCSPASLDDVLVEDKARRRAYGGGDEMTWGTSTYTSERSSPSNDVVGAWRPPRPI